MELSKLCNDSILVFHFGGMCVTEIQVIVLATRLITDISYCH